MDWKPGDDLLPDELWDAMERSPAVTETILIYAFALAGLAVLTAWLVGAL